VEPMEQSGGEPSAPFPDGHIEVDPSGRITGVDAQAERLLGWSAGELVGRPIDVLVAEHPGHLGARPNDVDLLVAARRRDGAPLPVEIRLREATDQDFQQRVALAIRASSPAVEEAVGRPPMPEEEPAPTVQSVAELAAGIAHDLNNSLSVIMIYSDLIDRAREHRSLHEDVGEIRTAAQRSAELTGQLMRLSQLARQDTAVPSDALPYADVDLLLRAIRMRAKPEVEHGSVGVVVVDDHAMFAESLARLLGSEDDIEVLGVGATGREAVTLVERLRPRVLLLDFDMPEGNGVEVATEIKARWPTTMIVLITGSTDDRVLLRAIEAGCSGYLTKDRAAPEVANAVRVVAAGDALFSNAQMARLLPKLARSSVGLGSDLTDRDRVVLNLLARGATNEVIAAGVGVTEGAARELVDGILASLQAHSKLEAVATAIREGVIDYNSPF